jgi:serine/threonine protein phosphatase 1
MTGPQFGPDIRAQHRRLDVDEWDDVYLVGDVHGCRRRLEALVGELGVTDDDLVVFVGDLVRKGPDSRGVLELVRDRDNFHSVRGNNEEKLLRGTKELPALDDDHLECIASMPVAISFADTLVVHGGVDPRRPLSAHDVDDLQNFRSMQDGGSYGDRPYWFEAYEGPRRVFFGHTVLERPVVRDYAVGLDTGCVYGGELTAYDWRRDRVHAVPGEEYEARPDRKFLAPPATPTPISAD